MRFSRNRPSSYERNIEIPHVQYRTFLAGVACYVTTSEKPERREQMPYRIGTSKQTEQNKTLVTIEGPGIEPQGFKLSFPSINDGEAFIVGLNFAFAHGFRAALGLPGCPECDRLWDEYVKASEEHVKLIEQKLAANEMQPELGKALESKIEAASVLRLQVRQQVKQHESQSHALATHF